MLNYQSEILPKTWLFFIFGVFLLKLTGQESPFFFFFYFHFDHGRAEEQIWSVLSPNFIVNWSLVCLSFDCKWTTENDWSQNTCLRRPFQILEIFLLKTSNGICSCQVFKFLILSATWLLRVFHGYIALGTNKLLEFFFSLQQLPYFILVAKPFFWLPRHWCPSRVPNPWNSSKFH